MVRRYITDEIWVQIQQTMTAKGCYDVKNGRDVMEAILWKLRTGAPWRDVPAEFCPWQTAFNRFNRWAERDLWAEFFLTYEAKLTRNGYSSTEVTSALISMQAELGLGESEPLDDLEGDRPAKFTWPVMRMEIRSILKSLGVRFTIAKQPPSSSKKSKARSISSPIKATIQRPSESKRVLKK